MALQHVLAFATIVIRLCKFGKCRLTVESTRKAKQSGPSNAGVIQTAKLGSANGSDVT